MLGDFNINLLQKRKFILKENQSNELTNFICLSKQIQKLLPNTFTEIIKE